MSILPAHLSLYAPSALCRMDDAIIRAFRLRKGQVSMLIPMLLVVVLGSISYGAVFGLWRSFEQALLSSVKMPILIFSTMLGSGAINILAVNVLGARLSFAQVLNCQLLSFAITAIVLVALSPIALLFVLRVPGPDSVDAFVCYRALLAMHTGVIAFCGVIGNIRLYQLLKVLAPAHAGRLLCIWLLTSGLVGCELSWIFSPFLAKPGIPIPFLNPDAFHSNFFEYIWNMIIAF